MPEPEFSHVLIYTGGIVTPQSVTLRNQLAFLNQPGQQTTKTLVVLSSWGGNTFETRALYGLIRSLSYGVEIHAVGNINSAAVPLMLAADRRTADPDASFLFHPWTWSTEVHPGHTVDGLQELPLRLEDDVQWAKKTIEMRSKISKAEIEGLALFQKPLIKDAKFALEKGLVHEVTERKIPSGLMTWNITA